MLAVSDDSSFPRARLVVPGVPCEPGAADGANTNTDSEQLEFTTIFEEYALEEEDSDVPVKFSQPTSSMMSSSD